MISKLKKQLLPTGRAFRIPPGSDFEKLLDALSVQQEIAFNSSIGLLNSIIPDNENFDTEDAAFWEKTLAVSTNETNSIVNRRQAIYRKMQFPSNAKGRQHKNYLEYQLNQAGFHCKVYEWDYVKNLVETLQHSEDTEHSETTIHGSVVTPSFSQIIARYIEPEKEETVQTTFDNLKNIFWIAGKTFDKIFNVAPKRLTEFRNIILTIKPLQTIGFLRISTNDVWILESGQWDNTGVWKLDATW